MDRQIKHNLTDQPGYDRGMTDKPFLTIGEVADILQVSSRTVYNLIYKGTLRACRLTYHITIITREDFFLMIRETTYCKRSVSIFARQGKKTKRTKKEERAREVYRENTDSIKSGIANLFGKGKYAAIEQENERLKAENEHIKESFPDAVRKEVAKRTKELTEAKRTVELERDSAMAIADTFESERDTALRQLREQKTGEQHRISMAVSRATAEKDKTIERLQGALKSSRDILNIIADILYKASEVFRRAIEAIIHFATEQHKSIFSPSEAADIKSVMQSYGETTEQQKSGRCMAL